MTNTTETSDSQLTHGVAVGDVRATSAVVWARLSEAGMLHVEYDTDPEFAAPTFGSPIYVDGTTDYTGHLRLSGLEPSTAYHYRIWGVTGVSDKQALRTAAVAGRFRTAPYRDVDEAVSFVWSGDMWGQGNAPPYGVLAEMEAVDPDFFLFLGDTVYADDPTPAVPEDASTLDEFRAKYREARQWWLSAPVNTEPEPTVDDVTQTTPSSDDGATDSAIPRRPSELDDGPEETVEWTDLIAFERDLLEAMQAIA